MKLSYYISALVNRRWTIGFVQGGMQSVFKDENLQVNWVKMPKDRWYADPFILDVTETEILLLVEDLAYLTNKGVISLLHINKATLEITLRKVLLELPTHLSFPNILRKDGHIYVYPESRNSKKLDLYEYHPEEETLKFVSTICDDEIWDSAIVNFGEESFLFTSNTDDNHYLAIYKWDKKHERFLPYQIVSSDFPNTRLGGAPFCYKGHYYYPAQDCSQDYGGALDIKQIDYQNGTFTFKTLKHFTSPNRKYPLGFHTLNEYKGVVVVDANGWRYGIIGALCHSIIEFFRKLSDK